MSVIEGWFDGVCEPRNPGGHAAYGALVKVDGVTVWQEGVYVGGGEGMSNNVAEYAGAAAVLRYISALNGVAIIRGDSKLVIKQLQGLWKVNGGFYMPYYNLAMAEYRKIRDRCRLEWIPRRDNGECDVLSKAVLKERGIAFRIQPE